MSLTKRDKEDITKIVLDILKNQGTMVDKKKSVRPDYDSWRENGIKSRLAGLIVAPEDYFEGDKKFFTWDEAMEAQKSMPDGWRLPTRQEWRLLCEEFGSPDPNEDYDANELCKNLHLERNGWVDSSDMDDYNKSPEKFEEILDQGTHGYWWSAGSYSSTHARNLGINGNYTDPELDNYKTYGFSVRCVAQSGYVPTNSETKEHNNE